MAAVTLMMDTDLVAVLSVGALFCSKTLVVGQEHVFNGIDIVISPVQEVPVWVRHRVLVIPWGSLEVFPEA